MHRFYPEIDEKNLKLIQKLQSEDATYLQDDQCPYSEDIKKLFMIADSTSDFDIQDIDIEGLDTDDGMLAEVMTLYAHLKQFGTEMRNSDTASEKNTYFKLSATLLEKLIVMRERVINIQKMQVFQDTVLQIMEDELDPTQRTAVMNKLKKAVD